MAIDPASASIERVFQRLNELEQAGLIGPYAIGGAFAFIYYAEPFETGDLDVFANIPSKGMLISLAPIYEHLGNLGYREEDETIMIEGIPVQILPATGALVEEAIRDAVSIAVGKTTTRIFTAEHAVAVALQTNRAKDRMKILHLQETAATPLHPPPLTPLLPPYSRPHPLPTFTHATPR